MTESSHPAHKRRQILTNPPFQIKYSLLVVALFGFASFLVWWETYHTLSWTITSGLIRDPAVIVVMNRITRILAIKVSAAMGLAFILSLSLSQYVAGPIYRLEKALGIVRSGDFTHRVHLRKFDQVPGLEEQLNATFAELQSRMDREQKQIDALAVRLDKISESTSGAEAKELCEITSSLRSLLNDFRF